MERFQLTQQVIITQQPAQMRLKVIAQVVKTQQSGITLLKKIQILLIQPLAQVLFKIIPQVILTQQPA